MATASLKPDTLFDTRERLIRLLRRSPRTVEDLAAELGITKNAVRSQINLLKSEGIVETQGSKPSGRRPAAVFGVRQGAAALFSKAYPVVLSQLVKVLAEKLPDRLFNDTARELGLRLAGQAPQTSGGIKEKVGTTVAFLESLGAMVDVRETKGKIIIRGHGCPISGAVDADGRLCRAMETMVGKLVGAPTVQRCDRDKHPGCRFEIKIP
jgi:predicted ArsR family transcriptional regulator